MQREKLREILIVGAPFETYGGGMKRLSKLIPEYIRSNIKVNLVIPTGDICEFLYNSGDNLDFAYNSVLESLNKIKNMGVVFANETYDIVRRVSNHLQIVRSILGESDSLTSFFDQNMQMFLNRERYIYNIFKINKTFQIIYCVGGLYSRILSFKIAKLTKKPFVILFQIHPFVGSDVTEYKVKEDGQPLSRKILFSFLLPKLRNFISIVQFKSYANSNLLKCILSVSEEPIVMTKLDSLIGEKVDFKILTPANGTDLVQQEVVKENGSIIFFGRLISAKGLLELPQIVAKINFPDKKLVICGNFYSEYEKRTFFESARKLNVNVEYQGFINESDLYNAIRRAKIFLNPTHADGFSLAILESVYCGTISVTYDIPAIRSVFSNMGAVRMVKEGNIEDAATEAEKILKLSFEQYKVKYLSGNTLRFMDLHRSWRKVFESEVSILNEYVDH